MKAYNDAHNLKHCFSRQHLDCQPSTNSTTGISEPTITNKPSVSSRPLPEDVPVNRAPGGAAAKISKNINRGLILLQLVQLGIAAYEASQAEADGEKFGYYSDPFLGRYVITDPEKAAQNLPEGFVLKFFLDPNDLASTGLSITFKVENGKFVNIDRNYPEYQLYKDDKGMVRAGVLM